MAEGPDQIVFAWSTPRRDGPDGPPAQEHAVSPVTAEKQDAALRVRRRRSPARDLRPSSPPRTDRDEQGGDLPPETELWRIAHAAQFLKMSPSWIYKRVERGELPFVRVNGWALRFIPADLRAWAESQAKRRSRAARNSEP
jgi:excisionase family DNA binding protein